MYYYPKIDLIACASRKTDKDLVEFYNSLIEFENKFIFLNKYILKYIKGFIYTTIE